MCVMGRGEGEIGVEREKEQKKGGGDVARSLAGRLCLVVWNTEGPPYEGWGLIPHGPHI